MGPQATQVFYQYVLDRTEASCDQEHLPALILSDTGVPDRTASILTGNTEPMYQRLLADARLLEECGCTVIAIPVSYTHLTRSTTPMRAERAGTKEPIWAMRTMRATWRM